MIPIIKDRRNFIKQICLGAVSLQCLPLISQSNAIKGTHLFIDESSTFPNNSRGPFTIGILASQSPAIIKQKISQLRIKHHYRSILRYRSTDRHKLAFAKDILDYFFNEPDLSFHARILKGEIDSRRQDFGSSVEKTYHLNYKKIISDTVTDRDSLYVYLRNGGKSGEAIKKLESYLLQSVSKKINIKLDPSNEVCQLTDLLTGSVYGDELELKNKVKVETLNYLKKKLAVNKIADLYNKQENKKFVVTVANI